MAARIDHAMPTSRDARLRRHNRALMDLARMLWREGHDLEHALATITETAADVLAVDRVNVWQLEPNGLRCIHGFERGSRSHHPGGDGEFIELEDSAYAAALQHVRVIRAADISESAVAAPWSSMDQYLQRHRIHSLLDAPVRTSGQMYGVICHEHVDDARQWRADEIAFAGNMGDFVALAVEIQRRKHAEAKLDHLRLNDPVSGLGNRTMFRGAVQLLLQHLTWRRSSAAMLFIDIDRFHSVNTASGESGGDAFLGQLGERISVVSPEDAVVARVESDCFAVLLPRLDHEWQATCLADDVLAEIAGLIERADRRLDIGASIGIAFFDGSQPTTAEELLRDADFASKQAKKRGRNRHEVFDADQHRCLRERIELEHTLRKAFRDDELAVAYQPEVDAARGVMVAAEALLRWRQPDGSLRVAADFIDVAESSGLIVPIGWWVLQHACAEAVDWPAAADGSVPTLRVNLSARQFEHAGLAERVGDILRASGLPPQRLCLELTETTLMTRAQSALDTLLALRSLGVSLAIDDFGTGYSSLTYLKRFPVDTLKIDRSFVEGLPHSVFDRSIVESVIGLARAMGIEVVAEGVERVEQQDALLGLGLHRMQGWLYSQALPGVQLREFLQRLPVAARGTV
ncbi:MAG: GGDEF and EAL domain-containing protein [Pseudomonadota bacterium]|nr:GGDEF and EAL domain-containing protein [Pseudomonadota bacterium]